MLQPNREIRRFNFLIVKIGQLENQKNTYFWPFWGGKKEKERNQLAKFSQ
jgi:hypothetical protein